MHESYSVTERFFLGEKGRQGGTFVPKLQPFVSFCLFYLVKLLSLMLSLLFDRAQLNLQKL